MKTKTTTHTIAVIAALTVATLGTVPTKADSVDGTNALIYNNRAYVHAIQGSPNPVADSAVKGAEIVYVDKAYGQAIFSYPTNLAFQHTEFNVEYVDTAYGQAIYSYPNNNVKHHLNLVGDSDVRDSGLIIPAAVNISETPAGAIGTLRLN